MQATKHVQSHFTCEVRLVAHPVGRAELKSNLQFPTLRSRI